MNAKLGIYLKLRVLWIDFFFLKMSKIINSYLLMS